MFGLKSSHTFLSINPVGLPADRFWRMNSDSRGKVVTCLKGMLWISQEGDHKDYVLTPGQEFVVTQRGLVVVQTLRDALMQVKLPAQA